MHIHAVSSMLCSVMSGIITGPYFKAYFNDPGPGKIGAMVSILEIGAFGMSNYFMEFIKSTKCSTCTVTSLASGRVGDLIGRKMTLFWGAVVFTIGGAIQTFANGFIMMAVGRIVSGFGVGLLS